METISFRRREEEKVKKMNNVPKLCTSANRAAVSALDPGFHPPKKVKARGADTQFPSVQFMLTNLAIAFMINFSNSESEKLFKWAGYRRGIFRPSGAVPI